MGVAKVAQQSVMEKAPRQWTQSHSSPILPSWGASPPVLPASFVEAGTMPSRSYEKPDCWGDFVIATNLSDTTPKKGCGPDCLLHLTCN